MATDLDQTDSSTIGADSGDEAPGRKWLPLALAAGLVALVVIGGLLLSGRPKAAGAAGVLNPVNAAVDPNAANFSLSHIAMSEAGNMAGGKTTYIDGHIANHGRQTVSAMTVQVLFRNAAGEVAQNETMPLTLIRTREPYVDTQSMAAAPLQPGGEQDFRLIFDKVSPEWAGAVPEIRILRLESR